MLKYRGQHLISRKRQSVHGKTWKKCEVRERVQCVYINMNWLLPLLTTFTTKLFLKPHISVSEGGVRKRHLEKNPKRACTPSDTDAEFEQAGLVTSTELPPKEWQSTTFVSQWQVTLSHGRLPSQEPKHHVHSSVAKPPSAFLKQSNFNTQGMLL